MNFHVGQKVVCVDAKYTELVDGNVYEIRWQGVAENFVPGTYAGVRVVGIHRVNPDGRDQPFQTKRFRPLELARAAQMSELKLTTVPRDLYYHEVAYVRGLEARAKERDELYGYVLGLLGLLQLVGGRDDVPADVKDIFRTNHRAADAAAYLTQIVPPAEKQEASE